MCYISDDLGLLYSNHDYKTIEHFLPQARRLLRPAQSLCATPIALAVSKNGSYVVATCRDPPVIYISRQQSKNLVVQLQSQVSSTPATEAAFHPHKHDVLVLCFLDGSIAAYRIGRLFLAHPDGSQIPNDALFDCSIGRIPKVLRTTSSCKKGRSRTITGVAVLPSHNCRVVVARSDGRCRLVDLEGQSRILRTWHTHLGATAVAISNPQCENNDKNASVIAIGLEDCSVAVYTTLGDLLTLLSLAGPPSHILSLGWMPGAISNDEARPSSIYSLATSFWHTNVSGRSTLQMETCFLKPHNPGSTSIPAKLRQSTNAISDDRVSMQSRSCRSTSFSAETASSDHLAYGTKWPTAVPPGVRHPSATVSPLRRHRSSPAKRDVSAEDISQQYKQRLDICGAYGAPELRPILKQGEGVRSRNAAYLVTKWLDSAIISEDTLSHGDFDALHDHASSKHPNRRLSQSNMLGEDETSILPTARHRLCKSAQFPDTYDACSEDSRWDRTSFKAA